jgi:hypothetical protein
VEFNEIQAVANVVKISPAKENDRTRFGEFRGSVRDVKTLLSLPKIWKLGQNPTTLVYPEQSTVRLPVEDSGSITHKFSDEQHCTVESSTNSLFK